MKYLISNVTGIVGKYLVKELIENPAKYQVDQIVGLSRQFRYLYEDHPGRQSAILLECCGNLKYNQIRLISQFSPDIILHTAGEARQNAPAKDTWQANVDTTLHLLESCKVLPKVNFVYCSSVVADIYPMSLYAASKIAGESLVTAYSHESSNITGVSLRFPAVVGAGNKHGVLKDIISKLLDKSTDTLSLLTNSCKPFVYAGELAKILLDISSLKVSGDLQCCSPDNCFVKDIAYIAMGITNISKEIRWSESWYGDQLEVKPVYSFCNMLTSKEAIKLAVDDILKEDYNL